MDLNRAFSDAVCRGDLAGAKKLLKQGVDPDAWVESYAGPPLILAVDAGHEDLTRWLLGLPVARPAGLLHRACYASRMYKRMAWLAPQLVEDGTSVNAVDDDGCTPLHFATDEALVRLLLARGADAKHRAKDGSTPLHAATRGFARTAVLALLLDHGADLGAKDRKGKTALDWARKEGASLRGTVTFLSELSSRSAPASASPRKRRTKPTWDDAERLLHELLGPAIAKLAKKLAKTKGGEGFRALVLDVDGGCGDVFVALDVAGGAGVLPGGFSHPEAAAIHEADAWEALWAALGEHDRGAEDHLLQAACRVLVRLEAEGALDAIPHAKQFEALVVGHDETEKAAKARMAAVRKAMRA